MAVAGASGAQAKGAAVPQSAGEQGPDGEGWVGSVQLPGVDAAASAPLSKMVEVAAGDAAAGSAAVAAASVIGAGLILH